LKLNVPSLPTRNEKKVRAKKYFLEISSIINSRDQQKRQWLQEVEQFQLEQMARTFSIVSVSLNIIKKGEEEKLLLFLKTLGSLSFSVFAHIFGSRGK
jgi:hypothetical protein